MSAEDPQPVAKPQLSPDEVAKLRQLDLENLRAKVAEGNPLSESELRRLREAEANYVQATAGDDETPGAPVWVKGQDALAQALGYKNRKTIQRWLKNPGNPGEGPDGQYDVTAWRAYQKRLGREKTSSLPDKASAEIAGIILRNEKLQLDNEHARGDVLSIDEVCAVLTQMANAAAQRLSGARHTLGPEVVGVSVPEATKRIAVEHTAVLQELSEIPTHAKKKDHPQGLFWKNVSRRLSALLQIDALGAGPSSTS